MAGRDMKVNLIANTSQFKSAMSESSNQIKLINSEFKNAAAGTDEYGNRLDSTGAKQKQLSGTIEQYRNRIKAIKDEQRHWTSELRKGNITQEQHSQKQRELARRLNNTEAEMKKYQGQLKRINAEGKATTRTYADFDRQFRNVGRTMRNVGAQVGITAGVGFMGMKRVMGDVIGEAKDFHSGMSEVKAISGATGEEMEKLTGQAKDLGKQTKFTALEASQAQANLARAGFEVNEVHAAMPGLLDLAASSNMELGNAASITSNIIRGFNKDAGEAGNIADVLAKGAATANTDVEGLGQAMEVVAPVANSLDIEFESVAASAGLMADAGIDGSKSGRMLRQGMLRLSDPTGEAADLIEELGINAFDADGNMESLDEVVGELEDGLEGQSKQARAAALSTIFGSESTAGWSVLLEEGSGELREYTKELENSDGAAKEMADTMQDNAEGAITRMQSALSGLKIELGEKLLPVIGEAAEFVTDLANKLADMDEATIQTIAQAGLLVTAVLGVTTVVAGLATGIGALMAFAGPVGLAITGGVALLGGLAAAIQLNKTKTENLKEEQEKAKTEALRYGDNLSEGTKKGVQGYTDLYEGAKLKMLELKNMSGEEAEKTSAEVVKAFSEMADQVIAELETQKDKLSQAINEVYSIAGEAGKEGAKELTKEIVKSFDEDIANYKSALDTVKEAHDKYQNDMSQMPDKFAEKYQEALKVIEGGSKEFAQSQDELLAIQKTISDKQGKIMYEDAQGYIKKSNESYEKSLAAANKWYVEKTKTFDQALAQGRISQAEYDDLMLGVESRTNEMMALAADEYNNSLETIGKHLDDRGKLIDIKTGEEFERKKEYIATATGYLHEMDENEQDYLERWKQHTIDHLKTTGEFSKTTQKEYQENLQAFLEANGLTREEAAKAAQETVDEVINGLKEKDEEAKKAGKDKGDAHKQGVESTKEENKNAAKGVSDASDQELSKGKPKANQHGKDKGEQHKAGIRSTATGNILTTDQLVKDVMSGFSKGSDSTNKSGKQKGTAHKQGIGSTKGSNITTTKDIIDSVLGEVGKGNKASSSAGKSKGTAHKSGLESTKGANSTAGSLLSNSVTNILSSTTDGGGGQRAGSQFASGVRGQTGGASSAGAAVARSGVSGLRSVSTSGAGTSFVSGFRNSISSGSVFSAAWNLGKSALSALKSSIDSHSPSKETEKLGQNFGEGFNLSIIDSVKESKKSAEMLGKESLDALSDEINKYKQSFAKLSLGIEQNKQSLTVEHTLDGKFNEMIAAVNRKDDDRHIRNLLDATLQQNQILMKILGKELSVSIGQSEIGQAADKYQGRRIKEIERGIATNV